MNLPTELQKSPPRNLQDANELFKSRIKAQSSPLRFIFPSLLIPALGILFYVKYDDLQTGLIWGAGLSTLAELWMVAMFVNAKKAPALFEQGSAVSGTIQSISKNANMTVIKVAYKEKLGKEFVGHAMVTELGSAGSMLNEGSQVPVLYNPDKPEVFMIYSDAVVSNVGTSK